MKRIAYGRPGALLLAVFACAVFARAPVQAKVLSSADNGFIVESEAELPVPPDQAYRLAIMPSRWWDGAHSYSGDAANFLIEPRAGGCFCEALPGPDGMLAGSVEHGRVVLAMPGKLLRMQAALGPLQQEGVSGALTFTFAPSDRGTTVRLRYAVGGYMEGGVGKVAPIVDSVLSHQLQRLAEAAKAPAGE